MSSISIPLLDLKGQYSQLKEELDEAIHRVLSTGNYVMGAEVEAFEEEWASYCEAKYCVGVGSGTDALSLTMEALLGRLGEKVLVPALTFFATAQAVYRSGNKPVFVDIDETGNVPYTNFEEQVALMVHMNGRPGCWNGDYVIEDSAQGHGCPLVGYAACFSFYPSKNLGAVGQAGAVVTNDPYLAELVREMRTYGERERFVHYRLTGNFRMDELQAAILRVKMKYLDGWNLRRRTIASEYRAELGGLEGILLPEDVPGHNYHIFSVLCEDRAGLAGFLTERGVQTSVRYPVPLHLQPAFKYLKYKEGDFPMAERWSRESLSLPIFPEMTREQVEYVCEGVKEWYRMNN